jgi:CHAT domain-containing protein
LRGAAVRNEQFTRARFYDLLRQKPKIVHIASHFHFTPGDSKNSFLLIGDGTALSLLELQTTRSSFESIDLLTLSACETVAQQASGFGYEIEGFGELAQRLGAKAVLASLWKVDDASTSQLMAEFYRLKASEPHLTKAEALQKAQVAFLGEAQKIPNCGERRSEPVGEGTTPYRKDPKRPYAHPYYWAPFILIGNWQ